MTNRDVQVVVQSRDVAIAPMSGGFVSTLRGPIETARGRNQLLGKPRRDVVKRPRIVATADMGRGGLIHRLAAPRLEPSDAMAAAASGSKLPPWLGGATTFIKDEIAPLQRKSSIVRTTSIHSRVGGAWEAEHVDDLETQRRLLSQQIDLIDNEYDQVLRKVEKKRAEKAATLAGTASSAPATQRSPLGTAR